MKDVRAGAIVTSIVLLGLVVVFFTYVRFEMRASQKVRPLSNFQGLEAEWNERFARLGVADAYAEYLSEGQKLQYLPAHSLGHIVGEALYRLDENNMKVCTNDFGYGCFHGFAGAAFAEHGLSILPTLKNACESPRPGFYLGCMHGIGHGILAYLGSGHLDDALRTCEPLQGEGKDVGGCFGGVFMEYNYNTMQSTDGISLRPLNDQNVYSPCDEDIPVASLKACYYEAPSWWRASLRDQSQASSMNDQFLTIGRRCEDIPDRHMKDICYQGAGNVIGPLSGYDPSVMREWCGSMPSEGFHPCYREALGHLIGRSETRADLRSVCVKEELEYDFCADKALSR